MFVIRMGTHSSLPHGILPLEVAPGVQTIDYLPKHDSHTIGMVVETSINSPFLSSHGLAAAAVSLSYNKSTDKCCQQTSIRIVFIMLGDTVCLFLNPQLQLQWFSDANGCAERQEICR